VGNPPPGWEWVWIIVALLVVVFGQGFGKSLVSWWRNHRAGVSQRETEARQQDREARAEQEDMNARHAAELYERMRRQLDDQGETIQEQGREIAGLREQIRLLYVREQQTMDALTHHAGWDFRARTHLPEDFPEPPPLMPPRDRHSAEWGMSTG
jgi:Sec-independent protein translocase protein TatA